MSHKNQIIIDEIKTIAQEKQISADTVITALKEGLLKAYERQINSEANNIDININQNNGDIKIIKTLKIVQKVNNPQSEIALSTIKNENPKLTIGDDYQEIIPSNNFSRLAIFQAIQVVKQSIREAEKSSIYDEFIDKKNQIVIGVVESIEDTYSLIKIGRAYAFLPKQNQIPGEVITSNPPNNHIKFYIEDIIKNKNYGQILASRTHPNFLRCLLALEIPEIAQKVIEIKNIARVPGVRAKVAIVSHDPSIDAIGACVGPKGSRTQLISKELYGEKIDIINWNNDIQTYIINALTPAKVIAVNLNFDNKQADVIIPTEQLSLAIGKNGIAVKLVARLTHWKINIISLEQAKEAAIKFQWNGNIQEVEYDNFIRELKKKNIWKTN